MQVRRSLSDYKQDPREEGGSLHVQPTDVAPKEQLDFKEAI